MAGAATAVTQIAMRDMYRQMARFRDKRDARMNVHRINSRSSSGTERNPTIVLTNTGKNTIKAQISTFEVKPDPNQITNSGAMATIGTDWLATIYGESSELGVEQPYDTYYVPPEDVKLAGEENDIGYNCDAGDRIQKSLPIYPGEPIDQRVPGRGRPVHDRHCRAG